MSASQDSLLRFNQFVNSSNMGLAWSRNFNETYLPRLFLTWESLSGGDEEPPDP